MNRDPQNAVAEYYVLKNGDTFGPFLHQDIVGGVESGKFAPDDFLQIEGQTSWEPLGSVVGGTEEAPAAVAPGWKTILKVGWLRLRNDVEERSFAAGMVCLGVGTACRILASWPFVLWAPWFAAAAIAAVALLRRKRGNHGAPLLLAALCIPLAVWLLPLAITRLPGKPLSSPSPTAARESQPPPEPPMSAKRAEKAAAGNIPGLPAGQQLSGADSASSAPASEAASPQQTTATPVPVKAHYAKEPVETPVARFAAAAPSPSAPTAPTPPAESIPSHSGKSSWWSFLFGSGRDSGSSEGAAPMADAGDLEHAYVSSLVLAKGDEGAGSGFICKDETRTLLYTNIHVVAKLTGLEFTRNDGVIVSPGRGELAAGRDVARFEMTPVPAKPLEMITNFDASVRIGDAVAVLGNSGGAGVVTALPGVINGIGPDRIEVSAEIIPGNSGSPIIHLKTGKVIGIAAYLALSSPNPGKGAGAPIRRFGFRIDNAATWESINWPVFQRDAESIRKISLVTEDLTGFLKTFPNGQAQAIRTESLRRDYSDWTNAMRNSTVSAERNSASQRFLRGLRFVATSDITSAEQQLTYTYFRDELGKQKKIRSRISAAIDNAANVMPSSLRSSHL